MAHDTVTLSDQQVRLDMEEAAGAGHLFKSKLKLLMTVLASILTLLSMVGVTQDAIFEQASTSKYLITVLAPFAVVLAVNSGRLLEIIGICCIVVAPFQAVATFGGVAVSPLSLLLLAAVGLLRLQAGLDQRQRSAAGPAAAVAIAALSIALIRGSKQDLYLTVLLTGAAAGYVFNHLARDARARNLLTAAFVLSTSLQAALAVYEFSSGNKINLYGLSGQGQFGPDYFFSYQDANRSAAALPDPISLGNVLAYACPVALVLATRVKTISARCGLVGLGVLLIIGLVATLSRMSWIAAMVGTLIALIFLPRGKRIVTSLCLLAMLSVALLIASSFGGEALTSRLQSITNPTSHEVDTAAGDEARLALQDAALQVGFANPVFGVGLGELPNYLILRVPGSSQGSHAHSTYYNLFAEAGVVGLIGLSLLAAALLVDIRRLRRADPATAAWAMGLIGAVLVSWSTDYTVRHEAVFAMLCIALALAAGSSAAATAGRQSTDHV